jgi:NADH-quinone oxidoreductase subunit L
MTAFYMFRLYATTFLGKFRGTTDQENHLHESPIAMTFPLILLAIASAIAGAIGIPEIMGGQHWLSHQLIPIVGEPVELGLSHSLEWILMALSVAIAIIALLIAVLIYQKKTDASPTSVLGKFFYNKWHIDELYNEAIVNPLNQFAGFLKNVVEKQIIDGAVNGTGKLVQYSSRKVRLIQNGQVGYYILFMVVGIILLFLLWFNDAPILRFLYKLNQN